ncbi:MULTISPECIES: TlpA disulfide reductase family protein [Chromobacterium]|uniref:TlpA family protein disulfide reductase n=1 Tax=Chromobacterium aquaticum TaxID=467180 RepID=A0ABV8ZVU8_9NEIS|nr:MULTISPECIES: TlpA disulfide reductase family protein [Chromobacterium]KMN37426.1 thioredoxin [Chromobacterium sp. LK1]MCD5363375.1 TlpA family protein disulfide reductase [Chromobacterium aquaticum]
MLKRLLAPALIALLPLTAMAAATLEQTSFATLQGGNTTLAAYKGKVTVLNFWATWCGPCREEMPMLNSMRAKLAPKGVEVVGVALDNKEEVGAFVRQLKISYPILLGDSDTLGLMRSLGNATGGLPYTLVLDRKGKVAAKLIGRLDEKKLEAAIKPYL